jgi:hypothetical protein
LDVELPWLSRLGQQTRRLHRHLQALWQEKIQVIPDDPNMVRMCPLDHDCVVCGERTLERNRHAVRGSPKGEKCPKYFNVRCSRCSRYQRMPDANAYKAWFECTEEERIAEYQLTDGRKVFFEVM